MLTAQESLYSDIVELHNRTKEDLEFKFDSKNFVVTPKKALRLPRHIALHGVSKHPVLVDSTTGIVSESLLGIDDDPKYPISKIDDELDMKALKDEDKLDAPVIVDGKGGDMEMVDVAPKRKPGRPSEASKLAEAKAADKKGE